MSNLQNYKIGVLIDADASKLQAEAKKADKAIESIGKGGFAKVKGELGKVASEFNLIPDSASRANSVLGTLSESFSGIAKVSDTATAGLGLFAVGVTATVGAGVYLGKTLFDLAKQASDYGSEIKDFQDKTGLAAETIGTLKFNLEQSGLELNNFIKPLNIVTETLYKASNGNKEATDTLAKFGVTAKDTADVALQKILAKIHDTSNETQKIGLAAELGGSKFAGAIRALSENVQGDLNGTIKKTRDMGLVLSQDAVNAADAFGDSLTRMSTTATVTSSKFALKFAPEITSAMDYISDELVKNQKYFEDWGETLAQIMRGVSVSAKEEGAKTADDWMTSFGRTITEGTVNFGNWINRNLNPAYIAAVGVREKGKADLERERQMWKNVPIYDDGTGVSVKARPKNTETDPKEKERLLKETQQAQLQLNKASQEGNKQHYTEALESLKNYYKEFQLDTKVFRDNYIQSEQEFFAAQKNLLGKEYDKKLEIEKNPTARIAIQAEFNNAVAAMEADARKRKDEIDKLIEDTEKAKSEKLKKENQERYNILESSFQREIQLRETNSERIIALSKLESINASRFDIGRNQQDLENFLAGSVRFISEEIKLNYLSSQEKIANFKTEIANKTKLRDMTEKDSEIYKRIDNEIKISALDRSKATIEAVQKVIEILDKEISKREELLNSSQKNANEKLLNGLHPTKPSEVSGIGDSAIGIFKDGLFGEFGIKKAESEADILKNVYTDLGDTVIGVFGQMAGAAEQTLASYILTGEGGGAAFKQLTAQIIAGLAVQAGIKAIFEVAEGFAAQATTWGVPNPSSIAHFTAAKIYGTVAVGAAVAGVGIGAAGGLSGKGKSGGSSSVSSSSTSQPDNRQYNFLRDSSIGSNQTQANNQLQLTVNELRASVQQLTAANKDLQSRINTQPAGVLVANGIKENRGLVSETVISEMSKNSTTANQFGRILGAN